MAAVAPKARAAGIERLHGEPGERAADLYERHSARVHRYCLFLLRRPDEAEDAVQTTFLNAQRALARGVEPVAESAWLLKIAQNVCRAHWSEQGRRLRFEETCDPQTLAEQLAAASKGHDELFGLEQALESLPAQQQRAILLREWQGLSYREIAAELDLTHAAVETLIFRARRALAAGLRGEGEPERSRLARAFDFGSLASALKSALAGLSGVKAAALVAVVAAGGLAGLAALPSEADGPAPVAPAQAQQPAIVPTAAPTRHEPSFARAETAALREQGAAKAAKLEEAAPTDDSSPTDPDPVESTLDETTGAVVGAVEETAGPVVDTAGETTSALTETVEDTAGEVLLEPPLADTGLLEETTSALDDAVSTLP